MNRRRVESLLAVACIVGAAGCAHCPVNPRLERLDEKGGYRFAGLKAPDNSDELFVILTFSGGGTRAAALSYGVLEQLQNTTVQVGGQTRSLLQEVDVISSISGGSFTAAYYALFRDEIFKSFSRDVLTNPIEKRLAWRAFGCPWNWFRLASPWFCRGDLAAEYYDRHIFQGKTFADLIKQNHRPYVILNATDMTLASDFEFTQENFDFLYSDLAGVPIGRAVAASSCFPVAFTPLTLCNHPKPAGLQKPKWMEWVDGALTIPDEPRPFQKATQLDSYWKAVEGAPKRPYIHLVDGGVADNLGIRAVLHALTTNYSSWSVLNRVNSGKIKHVLVIVVNARVESESKRDLSPRAPSTVDVLLTTLYGIMNNYTFETYAALDEQVKGILQGQRAYADCEKLLKERGAKDTSMPGGAMNQATYHVVEVSFERLPPDERKAMVAIPTALTLKPELTLKLRQVAVRLLQESQSFQQFLKEMKGTATPPVQKLDPKDSR